MWKAKSRCFWWNLPLTAKIFSRAISPRPESVPTESKGKDSYWWQLAQISQRSRLPLPENFMCILMTFKASLFVIVFLMDHTFQQFFFQTLHILDKVGLLCCYPQSNTEDHFIRLIFKRPTLVRVHWEEYTMLKHSPVQWPDFPCINTWDEGKRLSHVLKKTLWCPHNKTIEARFLTSLPNGWSLLAVWPPR